MTEPLGLDGALERIARLERRIAREREARVQAERMLEMKSLELYEANESLRALARSLEEQVVVRTSQLAEARDRAEEAGRAKSDFLAMMSHEIRTPLIGVLGMAELLASSPLDEEQRQQVATIRASGDTLLVIINDILDFSKVEADKLELEVGDVDLKAELDHVARLYRPLALAKGVVLDLEVDEVTTTVVRGDRVRIRQIVSNLVSNAVKFTHVGSVAVRARTERDHEMVTVVIDVIDTGIGIPRERLGRCSRRSRRRTRPPHAASAAPASASRSASDSRMMGGKVQVRSDAGIGSVFSLRLFLEVGGDNAAHRRTGGRGRRRRDRSPAGARRRGQRGQPQGGRRTARQARTPGRPRGRRTRGGRRRPQRQLRRDPDGHADARDGRPRGDEHHPDAAARSSAGRSWPSPRTRSTRIATPVSTPAWTTS